MSRRSSIRDLASAVAELREELRICRRANRELRQENEILREAAEPLVHKRQRASDSRSSTHGARGSASG
jgi:hypothetical protein